MIHRAPFGSLERFVAILLEHTGGNFPLWLAPTQVNLLSVSEKHEKYAQKVLNFLENNEIRGSLDNRNETIGKKIREASSKCHCDYCLTRQKAHQHRDDYTADNGKK